MEMWTCSHKVWHHSFKVKLCHHIVIVMINCNLKSCSKMNISFLKHKSFLHTRYYSIFKGSSNSIYIFCWPSGCIEIILNFLAFDIIYSSRKKLSVLNEPMDFKVIVLFYQAEYWETWVWYILEIKKLMDLKGTVASVSQVKTGNSKL